MIKSSKQREALSMDFGPLFITAGIAQAARDDVGFLSDRVPSQVPARRLGRSLPRGYAAQRGGAQDWRPAHGCVYHEAGREDLDHH